MKILSGPEGDGLVTNAEVHAWLREKKFDVPKEEQPSGSIKPADNVAEIARDIRRYIESSPAGTFTARASGQASRYFAVWRMTTYHEWLV